MASETEYASTLLKRVANWDGKSQDIYHVLETAFGLQDYLDCIKNLEARGIDPESYINNLDKIIDSLPVDLELRRRCLRALRKTCGLCGVLPVSYTIVHPLSKPGLRPFASGGFSDVWKVTHEHNPNMAFAIKSLRVYERDPVEKINKKFCKEVIVCKRAKHPNILSIDGVVQDIFEFGMVSQWMENGDILSYAIEHPEVNRLNLLIGVTRGLDYLHKNEVIHGDLKSPNILVDGKGIPRLSDFGLCSITRNINTINASTPNQNCTVRYCAPELLDTDRFPGIEKKKRTDKSDVYSLSMVIVELVTGKVPFHEISDMKVVVMISKGKRPRKPRRFEALGINSEVWKVAERCWHDKASSRPETKEVLQNLQEIANSGDEPRSPSPFRKVWHDIFG